VSLWLPRDQHDDRNSYTGHLPLPEEADMIVAFGRIGKVFIRFVECFLPRIWAIFFTALVSEMALLFIGCLKVL
jgi:hypothetical protein